MLINIHNKSVEEQSHRRPDENWMGDDWVIVPEELKAKVVQFAPYCDITAEDGVLTDVVPTERPAAESTPTPTQLDRVEAQVTYTAMMTDTLLEV